MKTSVLTLSVPTTGLVSVDCPNGYELQVVAITLTITGSGDGDQGVVTYSRASDTLVRQCTNALVSSIGTIGAGVGLTTTEPVLATIDPVTGDASYATPQPSAGLALVDVWWQFSLNVAVTFSVAVLTGGTLCYCLRKLD